ncbi:DUF1127 domain-containing protein [Pseudorhodoplanes sinuspersici]|uniref:YjiS-like domain-containing protein n=1 Tax=Pseudorhodoplanes sinuspersici TaxID=1235591 RepID=A0A1W6ZNK1_9HYPH|nr:DUF1127 domain-containing protein [Pseudorhodoplanes sinuspersici]ARP98892.1 hypothetical protein CAK95_07220 [Pseudorhodoplanes sinuspersici]RKE69484.1 uncharacterized protein DUF1127 [Pseudorhodoplanes sinuspersici]
MSNTNMTGLTATQHATLFSSAAMRCKKFAANLHCLFHRAVMAHETRSTLNALPDVILKDVGIARSEIDFVANAIASGTYHERHGPHGQ